ncbi:MAG: ADP-ribose-binding protein [Deferribacterales bacterium]
MRFETGNLLDFVGKAPVVITTNGTVRKNGKANLGSGNAKEMGDAHPWIETKLGWLLDQFGNHVHYLDENIISFPVEHSWQEYADIDLVRRSAIELVMMADQSGWTDIYMPLPGCGKGGLRPSDVISVLAPILDARFIVLNKE